MISALIRVVRTLGWLVAALLVLGIVLVAIDANEDNGLVHAALEGGRFFAEPFRRIVVLDDNTLQIAINWGIAAVVYVVLAALVAAALGAAARAVGGRGERRDTGVA